MDQPDENGGKYLQRKKKWNPHEKNYTLLAGNFYRHY